MKERVWAVMTSERKDALVMTVFAHQGGAEIAVKSGVGATVKPFIIYSEGEQPQPVEYWRARLDLQMDPPTVRTWMEKSWDFLPLPPQAPETRLLTYMTSFVAEGSTQSSVLEAVMAAYDTLIEERTAQIADVETGEDEDEGCEYDYYS